MSPDNEDNQLSNRANFDKASEDRAEPEKLSLSNQQDVAEEDSQSHICKICHRSFSSGRALGGHMSSGHVQAEARRSEMSDRKLKSKTRRNGGDSGDHECKICGKEFQWEKSLHRHIRSHHPERHWTEMDSLEESDQDDDDEFDLSNESSGPGGISYDDSRISNGEEEEVLDLRTALEGSWHQRSQRSSLSKKSDLDLKMHLAVQQLIRFASGLDIGSGSLSDEAKGKKPMIESTVQKYSSSDKAKGKKLMINEERTVQKSSRRRSLDTEYIVTASPTKKSKSKEAIDPSSPEVQLTCNMCNKKFETHQALGGHRASHFKHKITIENTNDRVVTFSGSSMPRPNSAEATRDGNRYICDVCNRTFPNGQALGGHKKSHVTEAAADQTPPPSQSTSTAEGRSQVEQRRPLDFDLNEMTPPPSQSTSTAEGSSQVEQRSPLDFDLNEMPDDETGGSNC